MGVWPPLHAFLTEKGLFVDEHGNPLSYNTLIKDVYAVQDELTRQEEFRQYRRKGGPERGRK